MNKKVKEPFLVSHIISTILGIAVLVLMILLFIREGGNEIIEILIFALAAVINFISAIRCFIQQRMVRGNVYATICAIFLIVAVFFAMRYFIFL